MVIVACSSSEVLTFSSILNILMIKQCYNFDIIS